MCIHSTHFCTYESLHIPFNFCILEFLGLNQTKLDSVQSSKAAEVVPQASDEAIHYNNASGVVIASSVGLLAVYAVVRDLMKPWPHWSEIRGGQSPSLMTMHVNDRQEGVEPQMDSQFMDYNEYMYFHDGCEGIEPQMESKPISEPNDVETEQHLTFMDAHPGYKTTVDSFVDPIRTAALNTDATLDQFFSRPLKIASYEWQAAAPAGGLLYDRINPWSLYFENPRVINRISNYKLMSAKLHVKFTINGNAFHYGRVICSYNPLPAFDTMTVDRAFLDVDVVAASQRPHIYIDPTNSQGGEMCLPFFTPRNLLDITSMDWREMGELVIHSIQGLKHANGATDTVTINVFAWAEDVQFAIPTQTEPGAIAPQAETGGIGDEYGKKPVSRIAGAVANMASYLVNAPWIGPFARATEIGANAVGTIATIFGYSSPACIELSHFRPVTVANYSVANMPSDAMKTTVDAKQELSIDPRTVGLSNVDELDINYIASHESWFASFPWTLGTSTEEMLFNAVVDPGVHQNFNNEIHLTATAFAAAPFKYWRGTLRYRFQVVCSKYHKGRLKIVYDPSGNPSGTAEYNTAYTTVVDISDTSDFSIDVGWGQREPYRESWGVNAPNSVMFDLSPLTYTSPAASVGNGTLAVYVVNELTVPNSTVNNDIEINVFVSACEDFEVASPDLGLIPQLRFFPPFVDPSTTSPGCSTHTRKTRMIAPQAEEGGMSEEKLKNDSEPQHTTSKVTMANKVPSTGDPTNLIYFGEKVKSMRQLAKRYSMHRVLPGDSGAGNGATRVGFTGSAFPVQVGFNGDVPVNRVNFSVVGGVYLYGFTTFLNYLSSAYGGWRGSIRHLLDTTDYQTGSGGNFLNVQMTRNPDGRSHRWLEGVERDVNTWIPQGLGPEVNSLTSVPPWDGTVMQNTNVNPICQAEYPYQKPYRFAPAKRLSLPSEVDEFDTGYEVYLHGVGSTGWNRSFMYTHVGAGEDFTCFFYLGPPILYLEDSAPEI